MKKISKQELRKVIQEEIEKELANEGLLDDLSAQQRSMLDDLGGLLRGGWNAVSEWAISALVGKIIEHLGWDPKGFLALSLRKGVANIDLDEWKSIITDEGGKRCFYVADNLMEGVIEGLAEKLLNTITDTLEDSTSDVLSLISKTPQGMVASQVITPAAFGITKEAITNMIKDIEVIQDAENKLAGIVCREVNKLSDRFFD